MAYDEDDQPRYGYVPRPTLPSLTRRPTCPACGHTDPAGVADAVITAVPTTSSLHAAGYRWVCGACDTVYQGTDSEWYANVHTRNARRRASA